MADALQAFRVFLTTRIAPALKSEGLSRKGNAFSRRVGDGNLAVIKFARRSHSTPEKFIFLVGLGVVSWRIWWFERGSSSPPANPTDFHWDELLGELLPDKVKWGWWISTIAEAQPLAETILTALDGYGIPLLMRQASDQALVATWSSRLDSGREWMGDIRPLYRLSILAAAHGETDLLDRTLTTLRKACEGLPCARSVEAHIEKLQRWRWGNGP